MVRSGIKLYTPLIQRLEWRPDTAQILIRVQEGVLIAPIV